MRIYSALKIGDHHINHCEDYLVISDLSNHKSLYAVMDGCSMGIDSYFASTLTGKLLRKIAKEYAYKQFISKGNDPLQLILKEIVQQLFSELHSYKHSLQLEMDEVLNTLLIAVIDSREHAGEFLCIGDGLICIDGQLTEFEQDDKPDYLGYHLNEDFNQWYESQRQQISVSEMKDFSIATDGIFTFRKFDNKIYQASGDVINFLLNNAGHENENMLERKLMEIQTEWGLKPTDDIAVIRGIL